MQQTVLASKRPSYRTLPWQTNIYYFSIIISVAHDVHLAVVWFAVYICKYKQCEIKKLFNPPHPSVPLPHVIDSQFTHQEK